MTLNDPKVLAAFKKAAATFTKRATRSRKAAMKVLTRSGIYTRTGKLTKHYRPEK